MKSEFNLVTINFLTQNQCLNDPIIELNEKTVKEKYHHASITFLCKNQE
jgi:hypothetical protein